MENKKKQGPKNRVKKEYTFPEKKINKKIIVKNLKVKIDQIEPDGKNMIEQVKIDNLFIALESNEFNFDTDSLSEKDIENQNEDHIYLEKFTLKKYTNEIDIHNID